MVVIVEAEEAENVADRLASHRITVQSVKHLEKLNAVDIDIESERETEM